MGTGDGASVVGRWMAGLFLLVLAAVLVVATADRVHSRLMAVGGWFWVDYASELRVAPVAPDCEVDDLKRRLETCVPSHQEGQVDGEEFDPFADDASGEDEFDPFADEPADDFDPFADEPPGDFDPFAEEPGDVGNEFDPFGEPAAPSVRSSGADCRALESAMSLCETRHAEFQRISDRATSGVLGFRVFESAIQWVSNIWIQHTSVIQILLVLLGAVLATARRVPIALKPIKTRLEDRVSQGAQLVGHLMLTASCYTDWSIRTASDAESQGLFQVWLWMLGFSVLSALNLWNLLRPPETVVAGGSALRGILTIPLYTFMALIAGTYFLVVEYHPSGLAVYLAQFTSHPSIYIAVALYVWAGMLLERTRIARLSFDVFRPWNLPPAWFVGVVVCLSAIPTAYSGASGIFVIAAGAVIYEELRRAGVNKSLSLAATAMSGSLGVVLNPCLVVVLIAALNNEVTSSELFASGLKVYLLTATLFFFAVWMRPGPSVRMANIRDALPESLSRLKSLVPYVVVGFIGIGGYRWVLETELNENTAWLVLPVVLLASLVYDRWAVRKNPPVGSTGSPERAMPSILRATSEAGGHIGALLPLMALTVCMGGVAERTEVMALLPGDLGSEWTTMAVLVVAMVLVGMTMDALGAVILVSITIAELAYANGIDPVHFWMVVLVAFELGYLTPPVAINHLLTRQVVGAEADVIDDLPPNATFWQRHERYLLPISVMSTALVLVAFVPLFFYA